RPEIAGDKTTLSGLFHPEVQSYLHSQSKQFQPIDIEISCAPLLITGANMSGKTVILKSIALAQTLLQFGFYVPARHASLMLMDEIMLSMGEQGRGEDGLSSFATEILLIDRMVKTVKKNVKIMALVDELARTTNPEEGKRIVKAFLEIMQAHNTPAIVTTHYAGIGTSVRRLRIKGLNIVDSEKITPATLNDHIDYSLVEVTQDDVPEEALRIAEILGVEEELVRKARK
ncbi:MAG: DNA mismatch repair protein MutS, partial [Bacteroidales bacterium]|nr:DNA mismatch repair protein MutS [Bacteroidales bacterium]